MKTFAWMDSETERVIDLEKVTYVVWYKAGKQVNFYLINNLQVQGLMEEDTFKKLKLKMGINTKFE